MAGAALFDLDGTLVDSLADITASTNHVRAGLGLPELAADAVRTMVGDGAKVLLKRALPDGADVDRAWEVYQVHHEEQCTREVRPYPGVRERLSRWHADDRPLAVVTNKAEQFATRVLEHVDLLRFFGAVIGGDSTPSRKPDGAPLREALRRLGAEGQDACMVGDGVQDLRAGRAAGLRTVAVLYGFTDPEVLRREGADEYWVAFGRRET